VELLLELVAQGVHQQLLVLAFFTAVVAVAEMVAPVVQVEAVRVLAVRPVEMELLIPAVVAAVAEGIQALVVLAVAALLLCE
jgi:hypothetical protein